MKKVAGIVCLCLTLASLARAQIEYIDTTGLDEMKATTTIFVIPKEDSALREEYKQAINKSWRFTPYKIVNVDELGEYVNKSGYSFFCEICVGDINSLWYNPYPKSGPIIIWMPYSGNKVSYTFKEGECKTEESGILNFPSKKGDFTYYSLFIKQPGQKDDEVQRFADINRGSVRDIDRGEPHWGKVKYIPDADPYKRPYWNPGLLSVYLYMLSSDFSAATKLTDTASLYPFLNRDNEAGIAELTKDTLYIPDYILYGRFDNIFSSKRHISLADIGGYPYPYKVITSTQLSDLLLRSEHPINFLTYKVRDPNLLLYDGRKWAAKKHIVIKQPHPHKMIDRELIIYNSERGIIYACFPEVKGFHKRLNFSQKNMTTIANAVKEDSKQTK